MTEKELREEEARLDKIIRDGEATVAQANRLAETEVPMSDEERDITEQVTNAVLLARDETSANERLVRTVYL